MLLLAAGGAPPARVAQGGRLTQPATCSMDASIQWRLSLLAPATVLSMQVAPAAGVRVGGVALEAIGWGSSLQALASALDAHGTAAPAWPGGPACSRGRAGGGAAGEPAHLLMWASRSAWS
jgi:hypothetical protein